MSKRGRKSKEDIREEALDINGIVRYYNKAIDLLYTQKARNDKLIDKYQDMIKDELNIPSNRFMRWSSFVNPYIEAEISGKVTDFDIMNMYGEFTKKLIQAIELLMEGGNSNEEQSTIINKLIETILKLENHIEDIKEQDPEEEKEQSPPKDSGDFIAHF